MPQFDQVPGGAVLGADGVGLNTIVAPGLVEIVDNDDVRNMLREGLNNKKNSNANEKLPGIRFLLNHFRQSREKFIAVRCMHH